MRESVLLYWSHNLQRSSSGLVIRSLLSMSLIKFGNTIFLICLKLIFILFSIGLENDI